MKLGNISLTKSTPVLATAVVAALMAMGSPAQVQAQQGLQAKISGQVNRALMVVDDGGKSDTFFVDNDNSSTRFRFVGSADVIPGLKAGLLWEVEFQGNDSNLVSMNARDTGSPTFQERHTAVFVEGGWGKLTLGQTDGAANGGVEVDLSGTMVAHYAGNTDIGGGFRFRNSAGVLSGPTIAQSSNQQDFESRYDLVRYDTPVFGGFRVAGSVGTKSTTTTTLTAPAGGGTVTSTSNTVSGDVQELALWYGGSLGAFGRLAGAIGWSQKDVAAGEDEVTGGSISWLHGSGFNATFGRTERDDPTAVGREKKFSYVKLGYKAAKHAVSVDFGRGKDQAAAGDEADFYGVAYVWTPVGWADFYAMLKRHTLDRPGASFQDIDVAMVGTRVRF